VNHREYCLFLLARSGVIFHSACPSSTRHEDCSVNRSVSFREDPFSDTTILIVPEKGIQCSAARNTYFCFIFHTPAVGTPGDSGSNLRGLVLSNGRHVRSKHLPPPFAGITIRTLPCPHAALSVRYGDQQVCLPRASFSDQTFAHSVVLCACHREFR
jgi:hypothetical protein